ncbi:MAG TPA: carboxymuconolactone decarboxylase family protein [Actinomycetota bacterium]|nr:carboxymuconolactone decarboxylase family protein [Actinomycetota bacterium]
MDERYERGSERIAEVHGRAQRRVVEAWGDLGRYVISFAYGELYGRPGLSLRDRELAAVAMLAVLGREAQLKAHLAAALRAGLSAGELEELVIHTVPFAGFPAAIAAHQALREVLARERPGGPGGTGSGSG